MNARECWWPPSFPDAVAAANRCMVFGHYEASVLAYELAAQVAPTDEAETFLLKQAWFAQQLLEHREARA